MASSVWDSLTCANLFVAFATVTGFAEKKMGRLSMEYVFVVEVFWSDGRTSYIRRTYKDFLRFYKHLVSQFRSKDAPDNDVIPLPRLEGKRWYRRYTRGLAEYRELELHNFVKELLKASPEMASETIVIDFFEQRPTDPVPCPKEDKPFEVPNGRDHSQTQLTAS
ncbi:SH3 and PX domain-containing protein 2B-like [Haliotis cracherodii]|uniref:SH3 and PX domain-containing protein 2B-like n=1 Tax=Haliotis cracherodii TaxID=6455 RepID=UPI0039EB153A